MADCDIVTNAQRAARMEMQNCTVLDVAPAADHDWSVVSAYDSAEPNTCFGTEHDVPDQIWCRRNPGDVSVLLWPLSTYLTNWPCCSSRWTSSGHRHCRHNCATGTLGPRPG